MTAEVGATDARFRSGAVTLAGTLTLPAGATPAAPVPGVLLLSGSGPLDRDGNVKRLPLDISRQLAAALTGAGLATLRFDKRGVGASEGEFLRTGLHDNVADAAAAGETLRATPGVDPERILVLGHSEGALLAVSLLAQGFAAAGAVLLSPTARRGDEVLLWQADQIAPTLPAPVRGILRLLRTDLRAKVAKNHDRLRATTTDVARLNGARVNARWFREFLAYDPSMDLPSVQVPLLAMTGSKDLQAPPEDLDALARAAAGPVETERLDGLSHILRSQPGTPTLRSYRKDAARPVDPDLVARVVEWSRQRTAATS